MLISPKIIANLSHLIAYPTPSNSKQASNTPEANHQNPQFSIIHPFSFFTELNPYDYFQNLLHNTHNIFVYPYWESYLNTRKNAITLLKSITRKYGISDKTFHLSLTFLDILFQKITACNEIDSIALYCLILATKYLEENNTSVLDLEAEYSHIFQTSFRSDEIYILQLLNYNLHITTSYDLLSFILWNEAKDTGDNHSEKFDLVCLNYLNRIIECKYTLTLTPLQLVFGILQICRMKFGYKGNVKKLVNKYGLHIYETELKTGVNLLIEKINKGKKYYLTNQGNNIESVSHSMKSKSEIGLDEKHNMVLA